MTTESTDFFTTLNNPVSANGAEAFESAAAYYEATDEEAARKLDKTFPTAEELDPYLLLGAPQTAPQITASVAKFLDVHEPADQLREPPDYNADYPYEPSWKDLISPTSVLRDAIWKVTDVASKVGICDRAYDPFELVLKPVCGDWAGLRRCGQVYRNASWAVDDMATNVFWARQNLPQVWEGNASEVAAYHLYNLGTSLLAAKPKLEAIAQEYIDCADGAKEFSTSIGVLLADIGDAAIAAAASAGLATLAGSTGIGLPITLIVGAFTMTRVYKVVNGIIDVIDLVVRIEATVDTFNSAGNDFGRVDADQSLPALVPSGPDLPA